MPIASDVIGDYLRAVADPSASVDAGAIAELQAQLEQTTDVMRRLALASELIVARRPRLATLRAAFVQHAKTWAEENNIECAAFIELGVDRRTLAAAGFDLHKPRRGRIESEPVAVSVSSESIKARLDDFPDPFTFDDVVRVMGGGSPMTVRKAVSEMRAHGQIVGLGPITPWKGVGRAPHQYRKAQP